MTTTTRHLKLLCCLLLCTLAAAADAQETKIGFVDIPYVIDRAPSAKAASARLEQVFAPKQNAITDKRAALKEMREKLERDGLIMTAEQRSELELQIRTLERRLRRDEQDFREELNIQKNNEFKKVRLSVMSAIDRLAREGGFDLILSDGVLFASKRLDLTERVLEQMQRESQRESNGE